MAVAEGVRIIQSALSIRNLVFGSLSVSLICCRNKATNLITLWFKITLLPPVSVGLLGFG